MNKDEDNSLYLLSVSIIPTNQNIIQNAINRNLNILLNKFSLLYLFAVFKFTTS
ncbi:hypothetical protein GCM10008917_02940 [Paraclostridium tenue]|uniref:Uncharacterized protein n=1 Tax=Paraclostridium tenue TaxID=1737 RepID=A0ABP3X8Z7_9FIRM